MGTSAGRYTDVSRLSVPGELPPESRSSRRGSAAPSRPRLVPGPDDRRRHQEARELEAERLARGRAPGQGVHIKHGGVADPNPSLAGRRQRVAINITTDALEREHAHGRITSAGYWAGRRYKAVLERSRRPVSGAGSWDIGSKVDQVVSHELKILGVIAKAEDADAMVRDTAPAIGLRGQRVLELVLLDEVSLTEVARHMTGSADRMHVIYYSQLFRDSVETLAEHWCRPDRCAPRA